jgi:ABC-type transport system involved in cytochrome bd biosynthesis fused ATPase/permease subunit
MRKRMDIQMIKTRLVGLLSHAKKYVAYIILWQWITLLSQIFAVFTIADLIENVIHNTVTLQMLQRTVVILAVVMIIRFICERQGTTASYKACVDVKQILREKIYDKMLKLGASYKEQVSSSEVVQVSTEGVEQLETYFGKYLPQLFYSLLAPITLFVILCRISMKASVVLLICVPLIPISIVVVQKIAKKLLNKYWSIYTGLGDSFLENLQGLTTLKIYESDASKADDMDVEAQNFRKITMKVLTMQLNSTSVMDIVAYGGAAIGMAVALSDFLKGNLSLSGTLCIVLLASEFFLPLRLLGSYFHIAMNGMAASDKIFRILDLPEPEEGDEELPKESLSISLKNVHFSYEENREILKGINLELPAGSFISLVGESGCGKSTIAGLLTGRNKGFTGYITIGTKPLEKIKEQNLMQNVVLVRHNSYLFKGTVEENLKMAKPDATENEMNEALAKVNLLGFLQSQDGLQTKLLEKASNLSGGQCQRLVIARAILKDAPVYIFDEATSNIDMESEEMIMDVIHELAKTKTVLLISHRLANVVNSDRIYMLQNGEIIEQGTHEELINQGGAYSRLYDTQQKLENYGREEIA